MACRSKLSFIIILAILTVILNSQNSLGQVRDYSYRNHELLGKVDSLMDNEKWDQAIELLQEGEIDFRNDGNVHAVIYTLGKIAFCHILKNDFDQAHVVLQNAQAYSDSLRDSDVSEMGTIYSYLSSYYFNKPDNEDSLALAAVKKAIEICESDIEGFKLDLALAYYVMGEFYYYALQDYSLSSKYHKMATEIREQALDPINMKLAQSYLRLGIAYRNAGNTHRGRDYLTKAIFIYENNPASSPTNEYRAYNGLANTYFTTKEFDLAAPLYEKAIEVGQNTGRIIIVPLNNLASTYAYAGFPDTAYVLFQKALKLNLNSVRLDEFELFTTYCQFGDYFLKKKQLDSAVFYFEKCASVSEDYNIGRISIALANRYLAETEAQRNNLGRALFLIQKSLIVLEEDFNDESIYSNPNSSDSFNNDILYELLEVKAGFFYLRYLKSRNLDDLNESWKLFRTVDDIADDIRNGPYNDATKRAIANSFKWTASRALIILQELYIQTNSELFVHSAFDFMEKNRYAQLFGNISKLRQVSESRVIPDSVYEQEQKLISEIEETSSMLKTVSDSVLTDELKKNIELKIQYEEFKSNVARLYPAYYNVNYDSLMSISQIQQTLGVNSAMLEYFWGDSLLHVLYISRQGAKASSLKINDRLNNQVLELQKMIIRPNLNEGASLLFNEFSQLSFEIFQLFVGNYIDENINHIIISPDGPLARIPFEALVTDLKGKSFRDANYLINNSDIQYIYSANVWFKNQSRNAVRKPTLLAFAYSNGSKESNGASRSTLSEIPASAEEVKAIKKVFGRRAKIFLGDDASESTFKELAADYDVLHLAVHGVGDTINSNFSRLIFRFPMDPIEDGNLYAHELYTIPFPNLKLAVLSACESGIGKEYPGEGIFSMARGFTYAGCPTTIMSLWKASDEVTAKIMSEFYRGLNRGLSTSQSLRMAKLKYIEESRGRGAHPSLWAAMVQLGDSKPIVNPRSPARKLVFMLLLLILIASLYYWRTKKNQFKLRS